MIRIFLLLCAFGLLRSAAPLAAAENLQSVDRFGVLEVELQAQGEYANPYLDLTAEAVIAPPNGGRERTAALFWDGGARWKLRFSPDQEGEWKWTVKSADGGLNGKSGSFTCVRSMRSGSIRAMREYPLHFERQDGSPFWFLGDTAWALFTDNAGEKHDRARAIAYIDARAAQGFNVLHSMLLSEAGWGNQGGKPFHELAAQTLNPAYWQEVDRRLAHANAKGIVCGLALAWGDKGRNNEPFAWRKFPDLAARKRYARYIAARYSAYDTYFLVSGEWHAEIRSRKSNERTVKQEFIEIGNELASADPHGRMIAIHPMTSHGSVRQFVGTSWMAFGDYQQNYDELHARILKSRGANKPVVNSEYGYFLRDQSGDGVPDKDNSTSVTAMRNATWDIVMAGGYPITGFGTTYFGGNRDPGPFDLAAEKNDVWEEQIGQIKSLFTGMEWWRLEPRDELVTCETPRSKDGKELGKRAPPAETYWCLADPGKTYVVYFRGLSAPLRVNLNRAAKPLTVAQFDPRTGEKTELKSPASDQFVIEPNDEKDWVLLITNQ